MSRDRQRSKVDLPEPESPMTMKISPSRTLIEQSRTAPIRLASASSALVSVPPRAVRCAAAPAP
jgi:hypothetical protein